MGRLFIIAALAYGYGDPGFDGHRPVMLDRSLKSFHQAVDVTARQAQRVMLALDDGAGGIPSLALGDKLRRISGALTSG